MERADTHFLWGQKTGEILPVPQALQGQIFQSVYMINKDYLYAVGLETIFPPEPKKKPATQVRTGSKPPPIAPPERLALSKQVTYAYVFKNERTMPLLTKIEVDEDGIFGNNKPTTVFDFYNLEIIDKKVTVDREYIVRERTWNPEIKPWHFYYDETFNIVCSYNSGSFIVMDENFKKITTIASNDRNDKNTIEAYFQSLYPDKEVRLDYANFFPSVSMGSRARKPSWQLAQKDKTYEISYLKDDRYVSYLSIEAVEAKIGYDDRLYLKDEKNNELMVVLNSVTLELAIPNKYKEQFKIQYL